MSLTSAVRRRRRAFFASLILCSFALSPAPLGASPADGGRGGRGSGEPASEDRIGRVENGLLSEFVVKGKPGQKMRLAERMRHHQVAGLSVAVINNYKIEWAKGYGVLDFVSDRPVTTETLFQAGSISKPVTTVAAFKLIQDRKIALDEDVNDKLVSWRVPENEFTKEKKVTVRGLLSHSAGITVRGFDGYAAGGKAPTLLQILNGEPPANSPPVRVNAVPGARNSYSGGGFTVLQQLMTDVTRKDFPEYMRETLFAPLKMKRSGFWSPLPAKYRASAAVGHRAGGGEVEGKWHSYPEYAAAGLWTTPSDLARLVIEIQKSKDGASNKILSRRAVAEMLAPQSPEVGLGFGLKGAPVPFRFGHNGSTEGYFCLMLGYMEKGQGAVIMTNSDNGTELTMELMRAIAREYGWNDLQTIEILESIDQKIIDSYVGTYDSGSGMRLVISGENGKLYANPEGRPRLEMFPESETTFLLRAAGYPRVIFAGGDSPGGRREIIFRRGGGETRLTKVK